MKNILYAIGLFIVSATGYSQTLLLDEGFQNGIPASWSVFDLDGQTPDSSISYINEAWVAYESPFDTCAISTSYYSSAGTESMDYLVSPKLDLLSFGHILSWESKSFDANHLESYYVMLSTTDSLPQSFTDTIKFINNDSPNWKTFNVNLFLNGFADQSVYIAFRNASTNQFILGVDNVKLTTNDIAEVSDVVQNKLEVYPTPVISVLNINVSDGAIYQMFSLDGKIVMDGIVMSKSVNVSELPAGVYVLQTQIEESTYSEKIIKL